MQRANCAQTTASAAFCRESGRCRKIIHQISSGSESRELLHTHTSFLTTLDTMRASQNTPRALCYLCKRQLAMAEFKATSEIWCVGIVETRRRRGAVRESTTAQNEVDACFRAVSTGCAEPKCSNRSTCTVPSPPTLQRRSEMTQGPT